MFQKTVVYKCSTCGIKESESDIEMFLISGPKFMECAKCNLMFHSNCIVNKNQMSERWQCEKCEKPTVTSSKRKREDDISSKKEYSIKTSIGTYLQLKIMSMVLKYGSTVKTVKRWNPVQYIAHGEQKDFFHINLNSQLKLSNSSIKHVESNKFLLCNASEPVLCGSVTEFYFQFEQSFDDVNTFSIACVPCANNANIANNASSVLKYLHIDPNNNALCILSKNQFNPKYGLFRVLSSDHSIDPDLIDVCNLMIDEDMPIDDIEFMPQKFIDLTLGESGDQSNQQLATTHKRRPRKQKKTNIDLSLITVPNLKYESLDMFIDSKWTPYDYQSKGIQWMIDQEKSTKCGILADEMGLGKTMQSIFLILKNATPVMARDKGTLIVCKSSIVKQWYDEINSIINWQMVKEHNYALRVYIYHGRNKTLPIELNANDIVITTFETLARQMPEKKTTLGITETLVNPDAHLFNRVWYRIILDEGHEIRNRKTKKHKAAVKLRAHLRWILTGTPVHNRMDDFASCLEFLQVKKQSEIVRLKRMGNLKFCTELNVQKQKVLLKRLRSDTGLDLPPKTENVVNLRFNSDERQIYNALMVQSRLKYNDFVKQGTVLQNYIYILQLIHKLRRCCCHPYLVVDKDNASQTCVSKPSTKIARLFRDLSQVPKDEKSVVFSQWTSLLDIVQDYAESKGIEIVRLDGTMNTSQRNDSIEAFNKKDGARVFLISLKAGGVGLNLNRGSRVFILDPWWNKAAEDQAMDRVYRIGQTRPVFVTKYVMQNSIEMNVQELQKKKMTHVMGVLAENKKQIDRLQFNELKLLFSPLKNDEKMMKK